MCVCYNYKDKLKKRHRYASVIMTLEGFRIAGPNEWNKLPFVLRVITITISFKTKLKTNLLSNNLTLLIVIISPSLSIYIL